MVLLISYDLNGHERPSSYAAVKKYIEEHATSSVRPLYSQWFVETGSGPDEWAAALRENNLIDSTDRLFICEVHRPYQGNLLTDPTWNWLNARI
jgi:hypothetical protein